MLQTQSIMGVAQSIFVQLSSTAFTLLCAFLLIFSFIRMLPGDPVEIMLGEQAQPAQREALREALGLNLSWHAQLANTARGVTKGDWGQSITHRKPVRALIAERVQPTLQLALSSMLVAILLAFPLGIVSGWWHGGKLDALGRILAVTGLSIPNFWLGPLLIFLFAVQLRWLPIGGYGGWETFLLPSITLGTALAALLTRMLRTSVADTKQGAHVQTARAKGAHESRILLIHTLRVSFIPVVTIAGLQLGALLSGAVVTETIFRWPGIGRLLIEAVWARDYPLVQAIIFVLTCIYIGVNTCVDLLYVALDPRTRSPR